MSQAAKLKDLLSLEALERLESWPKDRRARFAELVEDAGSDLQREMLHRALAAGREIAELHAFADAIRGMPDEDVEDACTSETSLDDATSVIDRLRDESDPMMAFLKNGHALSPQEPFIPPALLIPPAIPNVLPGKPKGFDASSSDVRRARRDAHDLGASEDDSPSWPGIEGKLGEDLINEAVRPLGVRYAEQAVDVPSLKLEKALESAAAALKRALPVPIILGPAPQKYARYALILQVAPAGASRAFQLHDPVARETVWANEGDLLGRNELPFSNKMLRRITAIALPRP